MKMIFLAGSLALFTMTAQAENLHTQADMSEAAQSKMSSIMMDYQRCMMQGRLKSSQQGGDPRAEADKVLLSCDSHLDELKSHLEKNGVNHGLAEGMTKKMRNRAARTMMTKRMNNMAAMAAAAESAQKMEDDAAKK
jgi:hypothetical protein